MNKRYLAILLALLLLALSGFSPDQLSAQDEKDKNKKFQLKTPLVFNAVDKTKLNTGMKQIQFINLQALTAIKNLNGKGPGTVPILLDQQLNWRDHNLFDIDPRSLLSLSLTVYRDIEKNSFIFYYLPTRYFIKWNPDDGYYLVISYAKEAAESNKNVLLQARMTPGIESRDYQLLKELIAIYLRKNGENSSKVILQPLPADYVPQFNILSVGAEDVALTGINPDSRELGVSITTDEATKELLVDQLGNVLGLTGNILLVPEKVTDDQPDLSSKPVDAMMRFCDNDAYARKAWQGDLGQSHSVFVNEHPLPVTLKYLCYLYNDGTDLEVRGYNLGSNTLVPGQKARINNSILSRELVSKKTLAVWYEYSFDCDSDFLDRVVQDLTGGVGSVPTKQLGVTMIQAEQTFDQYGIYLVVVSMRSRYFDPKGEEVITNTYELTADNADIQCSPLHLWDERARNGDISLYEYKLSLVMTTGDVYEDPQWRDPAGTSVAGKLFIGASLIEEMLAEQQ
jgi:cellulose biosynthesis protein BcsQ